ncbi:MAG: hypothetical protein KGZ80_06120 [Methylomonas sp.]|nr:hypothetical protein [Methylomonas sp.]
MKIHRIALFMPRDTPGVSAEDYHLSNQTKVGLSWINSPTTDLVKS